MELKYDVTFDEVDKLKTLVTTRKICSLVSIAACVIIMIIYFVLLFQKIFAKRRKLKRISNANYQKEKEINSSFQRTGSMSDNSDQNKNSATKGLCVVLFILMVFLSFWITISLMSCSLLLAQLLRSCEHRVDYCDFISLFLIDESDCARSE